MISCLSPHHVLDPAGRGGWTDTRVDAFVPALSLSASRKAGVCAGWRLCDGTRLRREEISPPHNFLRCGRSIAPVQWRPEAGCGERVAARVLARVVAPAADRNSIQLLFMTGEFPLHALESGPGHVSPCVGVALPCPPTRLNSRTREIVGLSSPCRPRSPRSRAGRNSRHA